MAAAGLGVALRTPIGLPASVRMLDPARHGLPELPTIRLLLQRANGDADPVVDTLATLIRDTLRNHLRQEWLTPAGPA
jgi:hypothetical protein